MNQDTGHPSTNRANRPIKPYEKLIWAVNSTTILFSAFWTICILQDFLVWLLGKVIGVQLKLSFDNIYSLDSVWSASQVLVIYGFIPFYFLAVGFVAGLLHRKYRLKKDLRKLYFLWIQFLSFAIFGGSFITSFIDRGNIAILWEYLGLQKDFMPMLAFLASTLLIFFGVFNLWKFLNMASSSSINKVPGKRTWFILCVQVIPLLILFTLGFILYPNPSVSSRFFSAMMIWVPVLAGLIASVTKEARYSKVSAFKDSEIRSFQPIYMGLAALIYVAVLFLS